jgi:hypothetical protein
MRNINNNINGVGVKNLEGREGYYEGNNHNYNMNTTFNNNNSGYK